MKSRIIEELGEGGILLPALVGEGLAANDRIKLRLSVLQAAAARAEQPGRAAVDLEAECRAAGVPAAAMTALINGAHLNAAGSIEATNLGALLADIAGDADTMIHAVAAGDAAAGAAMTKRFEAIVAEGALAPTDTIPPARVASLTTVASDGTDSLHRLVMDLHKALNRLAAACAEETVAGAHAFGLRPEDHGAVEGFMRGLNETRPLKFDHPGLDTMATRAGERLVIQNDIGTTDAHVVVIAVEDNAVTVTYTDVHRARARFFVSLLDGFAMTWSGLDRHAAQGLGDDGTFYLVTGRFDAETAADRDRCLAALGAALVFLIDWNKARKVLRNLVSKSDAVQILTWAARHRVGHRGFLELGGEALISAAVRNAAPARIGFGERLEQALGRDAAVDFLKTVLRVSTESLIAGRSARLIHDQIEAELIRHLERVDSALLAIVIRQAGLARDIAGLLAHHLAALQAGNATSAANLAARAAQIEQKADRIAVTARAETSRLNARGVIAQLADLVEQATDELEQAAFTASLLPAGANAEVLAEVAALCGVAMTATEAAASGLAAAADSPEGHRVDADDALAQVTRLIDAEHEADRLEREVTRRILTGSFEVAAALGLLELARALERATDQLAGFAHLLRHHVITDLST
jgi:uncharacterized protein Yka (UPF0111/DUF47 family)